MKNISILFIFALLIISSCKSSSKLVEQGDYDKAIEKVIKKLLKGKADNDEIDMLDKAYNVANSLNADKIKLLKSEGNPKNWEQIYYQYLALDNRQKMVRKVLPIKHKGGEINYPQIDYSNNIVEAKTKAADYFYNNGKKLMTLNDKFQYREAYYNFKKAKTFGGNSFTDLDILLSDAKFLGTTRVLVEANNATRIKFSPDFYNKLISINTSELNNQWTEYHLARLEREIEYDYVVNIVVEDVIVNPERLDQKEFLREKTVADGFSYALDSKGNVMKDSLGNDIKIPKYKDLKCTVVERTQYKDVKVEAQIEYISFFPTRRLIKIIPVSTTSVFENLYGKAVGDFEALTPEDKELVSRNSAPFPSDMDMIYDCISPLQVAIMNIMKENKRLIK